MKNFELQLRNLEEILQSLQSEDLTLSDLMQKIKQAKKLYKVCETQLNQARLELEQIEDL